MSGVAMAGVYAGVFVCVLSSRVYCSTALDDCQVKNGFNVLEFSDNHFGCVIVQNKRDICGCNFGSADLKCRPSYDPPKKCSNETCNSKLRGPFGLLGDCSSMCGDRKFQDNACVDECDSKHPFRIVNGTICVAFCPKGTYRDPVDKKLCHFCHEECGDKGCSGPSAADCVNCKHGKFNDACVKRCPFPYSPANDIDDNTLCDLFGHYFFSLFFATLFVFFASLLVGLMIRGRQRLPGVGRLTPVTIQERDDVTRASSAGCDTIRSDRHRQDGGTSTYADDCQLLTA